MTTKTIKIAYTTYNVLASLETERNILLLVKRPKGNKQYLAYQYANGVAKLGGEMPSDTTAENVFVK